MMNNNQENDVTFADFGLRDETVESLRAAGIEKPFEIQALTLEPALAGQDIIGQAKTGTGKTFAFGLPLLNKISGGNKLPKALILLPTRELAIQVEKELQTASQKRTDKFNICLLYGGTPFDKQIAELERGVDIVVGTPGRVIDLMNRRELKLEEIEYLVLDEADEMLNFGFIGDIEAVVSKLPAERQTLLFSATMPGEIVLLAKKYMTNPIHISAIPHDEVGQTVDKIDNFVFRCHPMDKPDMLAMLMQIPGRQKTIIFSKMKARASKICDDLKERGFNALALHGDLNQSRREKALDKFKTSAAEDACIMVATDVAARGIDIDDVTLVVNYECPDDETSYLHRTGRTGRAGSSGTAITLVDWEDMTRWKQIAQELHISDTEPEETYSSQDEFKLKLGIPLDAKKKVAESKLTDEDRKDRQERMEKRNAKFGGRGGSRSGARNGKDSQGGRGGRGRDRDRGDSRERSGGKRNSDGQHQGGSRSGGRGEESRVERKEPRKPRERVRKRIEG